MQLKTAARPKANKLTTLNVSHNRLKHVDKDWLRLSSLEELNLMNNTLDVFSDGNWMPSLRSTCQQSFSELVDLLVTAHFGTVNLKKIDWASYRKQLSFAIVKEIETIQISTDVASLLMVVMLEELDLSITYYEPDTCDRVSPLLRMLKLSTICPCSLKGCLTQLYNLYALNIDHRLRFIPNEIKQCVSLKHLNASHSSVRSISNVLDSTQSSHVQVFQQCVANCPNPYRVSSIAYVGFGVHCINLPTNMSRLTQLKALELTVSNISYLLIVCPIVHRLSSSMP